MSISMQGAEAFNNSIYTILQSMIQKINFDQTIIAEIIQEQTSASGYSYMVKTDTVTFPIESDKKYQKGDQVQILLPNGDYSGVKQILGRVSYSEKHNQLIDSQRLSSIIKAREIILTGSQTSVEFGYNAPYDILGLSLKLNTLQKQDDVIVEPDFGSFVITIGFWLEEDKQVVFFNFTNEDLLGNPKSLLPSFNQIKLFSISNTLDISKVKKITIESNNNLVKIQSASLTFGYSKESLEQNTTRLFSKYDTYVQDSQTWEITNQPLYMEWYDGSSNFIHNHYYKPINNSSELQIIKGMQYNTGVIAETEFEKYLNIFWKEIEPKDMVFYTNNNIEATETKYKFLLKQQNDNGEDQFIESNIIVLKNNKIISLDNREVTNIEEPVLLTLADDSGIYNYYGLDGSNIASGDIIKVRRIVAELASKGTDINECEIEWIYPNVNTGINVYYQTNIDTRKEGETIQFLLDKYGNKVPKGKDIETGKWGNIFYYQIASQWFDYQTNNQIICKITKPDGSVAQGSIRLEFGNAQHQGTNYNLNIDFVGNKQAITFGDTITLQARFSSADNNPVTIQPIITWNWLFGGPKNWEEQTGETLSLTIPSKDSFKLDDYCWIIKASAIYMTENKEEILLEQFLPIPFYIDTEDIKFNLPHAMAPNRIVHDMSGEISYYNKALQLFNNNEYIEYIGEEYTLDNAIYWNIEFPNEDNFTFDIVQEKNKTTQKYIYKLKVVNVAFVSSIPQAFVINALYKGTVIWKQPVLVVHNSWQINHLNNWTGQSVEFGEQEILSPFIAAGRKNDNNTFTGSMLGEVAGIFGLYGYEEGKLRYKLDQQGHFFVGNETSQLSFMDDLQIAFQDQDSPIKLTFNKKGLKVADSNNTYFKLDLTKNAPARIEIKGGAMIEGTINATGGVLEKGVSFGKEAILTIAEEVKERPMSDGIEKDSYIKLSGANIGELTFGNMFGEENGTDYPYISIITDKPEYDAIAGINMWAGSRSGSSHSTIELSSYPGDIYINATENLFLNSSTINLSGNNIYINDEPWYTTSYSDERLKNSISLMPDAYEILFDNFKPSIYKYNYGTSNRYHTGYITQDILEALNKANLTTQDFAGVILVNNPNKQKFGDYEQLWALRRDEFVALNTWQIQKLKARVLEQDQIIQELKQEIKEIKNNDTN